MTRSITDGVRLTREELVAEARRRFGEDSRRWAFQCPNCQDIATAVDFLEAGANPQWVGQACIGRHLGALHVDATGTDGSSHATRGCDWHASGLICGPWSIDVGADQVVFSFALAPAPEEPYPLPDHLAVGRTVRVHATNNQWFGATGTVTDVVADLGVDSLPIGVICRVQFGDTAEEQVTAEFYGYALLDAATPPGQPTPEDSVPELDGTDDDAEDPRYHRPTVDVHLPEPPEYRTEFRQGDAEPGRGVDVLWDPAAEAEAYLVRTADGNWGWYSNPADAATTSAACTWDEAMVDADGPLIVPVHRAR